MKLWGNRVCSFFFILWTRSQPKFRRWLIFMLDGSNNAVSAMKVRSTVTMTKNTFAKSIQNLSSPSGNCELLKVFQLCSFFRKRSRGYKRLKAVSRSPQSNETVLRSNLQVVRTAEEFSFTKILHKRKPSGKCKWHISAVVYMPI